MKKILCAFLLFAMVLPLVLTGCDAQQPALPSEPSEGLEFTLREDGQSYTLTGVTDSFSDEYLIIPDEYEGKPVTAIASKGFVKIVKGGGYTFTIGHIKGIFIPATIEEIELETNIISACSELTRIEVEEGNARYHSEGNCLIETATKTLITGCKSSKIPTDGSVTVIGERAFYACHGLEGVKIPKAITRIEGAAFFMCSNLKTVQLPKTITYIGNTAFARCESLETLELPDVPLYICDWDVKATPEFSEGLIASGCVRMEGPAAYMGKHLIWAGDEPGAFVVKEGTLSIAESAFSTAVTSIEIPESVSVIVIDAFFRCQSLTQIKYDGTVAQWKQMTSEVRLPENVTVTCSDGQA